ncbi:MAG: hypothetical protein V1739_10260 [Candidatus Omnitrophota bacterium]
MIELGLRAKLEVRSFLTGELMIAFDFYPDKPAQLRNIQKAYPELIKAARLTFARNQN